MIFGRAGAERTRLALSLAAAAIAAALLLERAWTIDYPYSIDFQVYWLAGQRVASGHAADLYAPGGGPAQGTPRTLPAHEFKNIPLLAAAFVPLAALPYLEAKRVFWWVALASVVATSLLLAWRVLPRRWGSYTVRSALAFAFLASLAPTHIALRHGQTTPLLALVIAASMASRAGGSERTAGVWLAAGGLAKVPLLIAGPLAAFSRRYRELAGWLATVAAALLLSLLLFGSGLHREYARGLASHAGTVMTGHNNQSAFAVAARCVGAAPVHDWTPRARSGPETALGLILLSVPVGFAAWGLRGGAPRSHRLELPVALGATMVALPLLWDHYLMMLAPCLGGLVSALDDLDLLRHPRYYVALLASTVLMAVPTPSALLLPERVQGLFHAITLSHGFIGVVLLVVIGSLALRESPPPPLTTR